MLTDQRTSSPQLRRGPGSVPTAGRGADLRRLVGEILIASPVALGVTAVIQWLAGFAPSASHSAAPLALGTLGATALIAVAVVLLTRRTWPRWGVGASWVVLAGLTTAIQAAMLTGTRYYLGGMSGDQKFRTEYLTRLAASPRLADVTYADLPPYYPAGWFWPAARFADLTGIPPWAAFKPVAIATFAVVAVVTFALWSVLVGRRSALLLSLVTSLIGVITSATEPYSWPASATIPPLAVLAWRWFTEVRRTGRAHGWAPMVVAGVALGVFGMTYTLLFGFFAALLVVLGFATVGIAWWNARGARTGAYQVPVRRVASVTLRAACVVGILAGVLTAVVWTPYLLGVLRGLHGPNFAARYLPKDSALLPFPMAEASALGLLCLAGVVWLAVRWRDTTAQALAAVAIGCYGWYLASTLTLAAHTTLLPFRTQPVLYVSLACAGLLGGTELLRRWPWPVARPAARRLAVVFGTIGLLVLTQAGIQSHPRDVSNAFSDYYPTGQNSVGQRDPKELEHWVPQLNSAIGRLTGRAPEKTVLLTDSWLLLGTQPYRGFQASTPHYANPAADYPARMDLIRAWARERSGAGMEAALAGSPFRTPDVFVLRRLPDGLHLRLTEDAFPARPNVRSVEFVFAPGAFTGPSFVRRDVGPYSVIFHR